MVSSKRPLRLLFCLQGILETWLEGKISGNWTTCDVQDLAASHIKAAEDSSASGRYIITNWSPFDGRFITDVIKEHGPAAV